MWMPLRTAGRILERLGFVAVTTTTPFVWKPSPHVEATGAG